jgi:DNA polymerase I
MSFSLETEQSYNIKTVLGTCRIVQTRADLPSPIGKSEVFLDFETNSFDPKRGGDDPHHNDKVCGVAVTFDEEDIAYYIPVRHNTKGNISPDAVYIAWLKDVLQLSWINHNIKFDAHFAHNEGIEFGNKLIDTLTLSKLIDSDRLTHELKPICRDWLGLMMTEETRRISYMESAKTKNFADVPIDILGEYACMDVFATRLLYRYLQEKCTSDQRRVWDTEVALTPVLYDMEVAGLKVREKFLKLEAVKSYRKLIQLLEELNELIGEEFTGSNTQLSRLFQDNFDLPVLSWNAPTATQIAKGNSKPNPSYDTAALDLYKIHPAVLGNTEAKRFIHLVADYRAELHFRTLFIDNFLKFCDRNGVIHPSYNQIVRTGRMSCRRPNSQQMSSRAKEFFEPGDGRSFLCADASQIEFRLIVHYLNQTECIKAYNENPDTDFHQWVADQCGIARRPAKNVNFAMGYGASKRKVLAMLAGSEELLKEIGEEIAKDKDVSEKEQRYKELVSARVEKVYNDYHTVLSNLRNVTYKAASRCRMRGYVFNAFGRRRHLPAIAAHKAFNSIIQGCAMDHIKERMVEISPRYNPWVKENGIRILANVHDSLLFDGNTEVIENPEVQKEILRLLEKQSIPFRVPLPWEMGSSSDNWKTSEENKLP